MELVGGGFGRFHVKGWSSLGFPVFGLVLRYARLAGGATRAEREGSAHREEWAALAEWQRGGVWGSARREGGVSGVGRF